MAKNTERLGFVEMLHVWNHITSVIVAIGGFILAQIFGAISIAIFALLAGWDGATVSAKLSNSVVVTFAFAVLVYGSHVLMIKSFLQWCKYSLKDIGLRRLKSYRQVLAYSAAGFSVYFVAAIAAASVAQLFVPGFDGSQKQDLGVSASTTGSALILVFVSLVILPPIAEEIAMRGFLYTGLRKKMPIIWAGLITSVVFAMAHSMGGGKDAPLLWAAVVDTFILSAVLIYVREKTDSLLPAIAIHMVKNCVAFLALFIFRVA